MSSLQQNQTRRQWNDPFAAMGREMMDRAMNNLWQRGGVADDGGSLVGQYPVDIEEDGEHLYVEAELPGFTREQTSVTIEDGVLTIRAERQDETTSQRKALLNERRFSRAQRSFILPTDVDEAKVEAKLHDGVLHLTLPKREEARRRKIEVK